MGILTIRFFISIAPDSTDTAIPYSGPWRHYRPYKKLWHRQLKGRRLGASPESPSFHFVMAAGVNNKPGVKQNFLLIVPSMPRKNRYKIIRAMTISAAGMKNTLAPPVPPHLPHRHITCTIHPLGSVHLHYCAWNRAISNMALWPLWRESGDMGNLSMQVHFYSHSSAILPHKSMSQCTYWWFILWPPMWSSQEDSTGLVTGFIPDLTIHRTQ